MHTVLIQQEQSALRPGGLKGTTETFLSPKIGISNSAVCTHAFSEEVLHAHCLKRDYMRSKGNVLER